MNIETVRKLALALPGVTEEDHFGRPSFRVRRRIFATLPDDRHVNLFIEPMDVDGVVQLDVKTYAPVLWGKETRGVRAHLPTASASTVRDLLASAWRRKAQKRLAKP